MVTISFVGQPTSCIALTVLLMGLILWLFAAPAYSMTALAYPAWFFLSVVTCLSIFRVREIQISFSESFARRLDLETEELPTRMTFRYWFLGIFGTCWILLYMQPPLSCAFALARNELDRIADEALVQPENLGRFQGRWAGIYRIHEVIIIGKTVVFYTSPSEMYGFARAPGAAHQQIRSSNMPDEDLPRYSHFHFRDFPLEHDLREHRISDIEGERLAIGSCFVPATYV